MYGGYIHVYLYLRKRGLKPSHAWHHAMKAYKLHGC